MRKILQLSQILFFIVIFSFQSYSADRYWINGSGEWNNTSHWAQESGGVGGFSIPTINDNVFFDNNSFSSNKQYVLIKNTAVCNNFLWEVNNYTPTLRSKSFLFKKLTKAQLEIHGSLVIDENIKNDFWGDIVLKTKEKEQNINIAKKIKSNIKFNGSGSWVLKNNLNTSENIIFKEGFVNVNEKEINCHELKSLGNKEKHFDVNNSKIYFEKIYFEEDSYLNISNEDNNFFSTLPISTKNIKSGNIEINNINYKTKGAKGVTFDTEITNLTCFESDNGSIRIYNVNGTANYTYELWDGSPWLGSSTRIAYNSNTPLTDYTFGSLPASNDYYIQVIDQSSSVSQAEPVTQPTSLSAGSITVQTPLTCFDGNDAALEANPSDGTEPYSYDWYKHNGTDYISIGQTTKIATGIDQGLYQVRINDANGCGPKSVDIFFTNPPDNINIPEEIVFNSYNSKPECAGSGDATIDLSASGGTGDIDYYLIRKSDLLVIPAGPPYDEDGSFTGLSADTYETYAIDDNGCTKQGNDILITNEPNPTPNITPDPANTCPSGDIILNGNPSGGSGAYTNHLWSDVGATSLDFTDIQSPTFNNATVGSYDLTYTVTDDNGCQGNDNITVNVGDSEDPTITCPGDVAVNNDAGNCTAVVNGIAPTATDNCGVTLQTWSMTGATTGNSPATGINDISGTAFNNGITTVTYHIEDAAANFAECNFTVTVTDNEDPTITCPGDVAVNNDAGNCTAIVNGIAPTTGDNCGVTLQTWSMTGATTGNSAPTGINDISGTAFNSGVTTVTYHIEDNAANFTECSFTVTVTDNENPTITCPGDVAVNNDAGNCSAVVNGIAPTATDDNCGLTLQTWSMTGATTGNSPATGINDISGTTFNSGITTVTYHLEDNAANFAECSFTVTVTDNEDPTITCPGDVSVIQDGSCSAVVNGLAPTATNDNCGVTLQTWSMIGATTGNSPATGINDISGTTFNIGTTTVTYHIEDASGNFIECSFNVNIYDDVDGGLIDANQSVCYNTSPNPFTNEASADVCGGFTYQWQMKTGVGLWTDISGATTATYTETNNLTETTYYNRKAISDLGFGTAYSDTITITIIPEPTAYAGEDTTLCYGTPYQIIDADTTNSSSVNWEILTGNGSLNNTTIINPEYTPDNSDGGTTVELVLHASGNAPCLAATDTIRITYLPELLVSIGKPSPYSIDSLSTHIDVYVKLSNHDYMPYLGVYLVSPLDSVVELKPYCTSAFPGNFNTSGIYKFYNDPLDTSGIAPMSSCTPISGRYKFSGNWKEKLQNQDPSNGAWRIRLVDNRNLGDYDGLLEEATIKFSDFNTSGVFESVLYADSSINMIINEYDGTGDYAITDYTLPITGLTTSCFGLCDATAVGTASGGQPPYISYEWSNSLDFSSPLASKDTVDLCVGKYYLKVTDSHGCSAIDSVTVIEPPEIVITNDSIVNNKCYGDTSGVIKLEFTGGTPPLTYSIGGDFKPSGYIFNNLATDTYNVSIIDISGCTKDTTIIITEPTEITYNTSIKEITCYDSDNGEIQIYDTLGGIQPYTFSIDSGATYLDNNGLFTSLSPDTFYVAVMDANGCEQFGDTIYMLQPDSISIDSVKVTPTTCLGSGNDGTITIWSSGGTGDLSYSINGGTDFSPDSLFTDLAEADYNIVVEDAKACSKVLDTVLTVTGPPQIIIDSLQITNIEKCYGDSTGQIKVFARGGNGNLEFSLNATDYQIDSTFKDLFANTYTITIRDEGMCTKDTTITITEPSELIISSLDIINVTNCTAADTVGSININASGGTGSLEYSIDDGNSYQATSLFIDLYAGIYNISVIDDNLCTATIDTVITETQALSAVITVDSISCNGLSDAKITITPNQGKPPYSYVWEHDGALTDSIADNLSPGWYKFTVLDSNTPTSCIYEDSVELLDPQAIFVSNTNITDAYCENGHLRTGQSDIGSIEIDVTGGTGNLTYLWSDGQLTEDLIGVTGGTYTLTITDENSCEKIITETINFDNTYYIKTLINNDKDTCCYKKNVILTANTAGADSIIWQWYEGAYVKSNRYIVSSSSMDTSFITNEETLYTLIAINNKCEDTDSRRVFMYPKLDLHVIDNDGENDGQKYVLEGNCCTTLEATANDTIEATYEWHPSSGIDDPYNLTSALTVTQSQLYKIIATTEFGCQESDSIFVNLVPKTKPYSGFSPNGDGKNDYWHIENIDNYPNVEVLVYNRWGNLIFKQKGYQNTDSKKCWNGTSTNGKDMPTGTYYFVIDVKEKNMKPITGSVTIAR